MRRYGLLGLLAALPAVASAAACGRSPTSASPPPLVLAFAAPVTATFVTDTFVAEFPVTLSDPNGTGGTVAYLDTIVFNQSRNLEAKRNRRPNASFALPVATVPAGGSVTLPAGVGYAPPPPRDQMIITVTVRLTDGREASHSAQLLSIYP
jgi:hypothetical protein